MCSLAPNLYSGIFALADAKVTKVILLLLKCRKEGDHLLPQMYFFAEVTAKGTVQEVLELPQGYALCAHV